MQFISPLSLHPELRRISPSRLRALCDLAGKCFDGESVRLKARMSQLEQLPTNLHKPEVAVCGESNVGKSSIIKAMLNVSHARRSFLKTSSYAGSTDELRFYAVDRIFALIDTPGYGYMMRRKSRTAELKAPRLNQLMQQAFHARSANLLHRVYLLASFRSGRLTPHDSTLLQFCKELSLPVTVVLTKADEASHTVRMRTVWTVQEQLEADFPSTPIIITSARSGEGIHLLQQDALHSVTKWLPEEKITYEHLSQLTYTAPFPSPDELLSIANKYSPPALRASALATLRPKSEAIRRKARHVRKLQESLGNDLRDRLAVHFEGPSKDRNDTSMLLRPSRLFTDPEQREPKKRGKGSARPLETPKVQRRGALGGGCKLQFSTTDPKLNKELTNFVQQQQQKPGREMQVTSKMRNIPPSIASAMHHRHELRKLRKV
eukprot:Sspe_Gene.112661::Locus_95822_Transcript_2_2_Confidence_0.667_Length_1472::g.112661::m.112661